MRFEREDATGGWTIFHNEMMIICASTKQVDPGKNEECIKILVGKPERNRSHWNIRIKWEHIIKCVNRVYECGLDS